MHTPPSPLAERIAALLDKAASTPYEAEADAFVAKAQELMARHAIDDAMLAAARGREDPITQEELGIVAPYASAKSALLGVVARTNRCRLVVTKRPGGAQWCVLVGHETDLAHTRQLYLSLSHQAIAAMIKAPLPPHDSLRRFRHAFLLAYATRIGERLAEAEATARAEAQEAQLTSASGPSVSLVMANREAQVERSLHERFPNLRYRTVSSSSAAGHQSGRSAADRAALGHRGVAGGGRALPSG